MNLFPPQSFPLLLLFPFFIKFIPKIRSFFSTARAGIFRKIPSVPLPILPVSVFVSFPGLSGRLPRPGPRIFLPSPPVLSLISLIFRLIRPKRANVHRRFLRKRAPADLLSAGAAHMSPFFCPFHFLRFSYALLRPQPFFPAGARLLFVPRPYFPAAVRSVILSSIHTPARPPV